MKLYRIFPLITLGLFGAAGIATTPKYQMTLLPISPLHKFSAATDLNDVGEVVGTGITESPFQYFPYRWKMDGSYTILQVPAGAADCTPRSINAQGRIVGDYKVTINGTTYQRGVRWSSENFARTFDLLSGWQTTSASLKGISDADHIVGDGNGEVVNGSPDQRVQGVRGTYAEKPISPIGFLTQDANATSRLVAVNSFGTAVGTARDSQGRNVVIRHKNSISTLGVPSGYQSASGTDINEPAAVTLNATTSGGRTDPFRWTTGVGFTSLPKLLGTNNLSYSALGLNDAGEAVGYLNPTPFEFYGVLWTGGTIHALDNIVANRGAWSISGATDINNRGEIIASTVSPGNSRAAILQPVQTVQIDLTLEDFIGDASQKLLWLVIRDLTTGQADTRTISLPANTSQTTITVETPCQGPCEVYAGGRSWLFQAAPVTLSRFGSGQVTLSLPNGDVDSDNAVTIFDYIQLSADFDKPVDTLALDPDSDLDGDGWVTVFDYIILSSNFDRVGD